MRVFYKAILLLLLIMTVEQLSTAATCTTTKVGNWSDPTVWSCGTIPATGDIVVVNHKIILNQNYTSLGGFTINSGGSVKEDGTARTLTIGQGSGGGTPGFSISDSLIVSSLTLIKSTSTINATGYVRVKVNFTSSNDGDLIVNGRFVINGNWALSNGNVQTSGTGTLLLEGCLSTDGGGQISNIMVSWCGVNTGCTGYAGYSGAMSCGTVLPANLLSFTTSCKLDLNIISLFWTTTSELNTRFFQVEKSTDGIVFETVASISSAGNSKSLSNYTYDYPAAENAYFRLRQVDIDGKTAYSSVIYASCAMRGDLEVFPNPALNGIFSVKLSSFTIDNEVLLVLTDILGEQLFAKTIVFKNDDVIQSSELSSKIAPGIYYIIASSNNSYYRKKISIF